MPKPLIHRFEEGGRRFAIDPETCFCFECDEISWDVLEYYPLTTVNRIFHELSGKHSQREISEVVGELEWLRATKSIFAAPKLEDLRKQYEGEPGLKFLAVRLPKPTVDEPTMKRGWFGGQGTAVHSNKARDVARDALALLLGRAGTQNDLRIEFIETETIAQPEALADACVHALRAAALAGKKMTSAVHVTGVKLAKPPASLEGHSISVKLELRDTAHATEALRGLSKALPDATLAKLSKALQPGLEGVSGRIVVRPGHPNFGDVVPELDKAEFKVMELDMEGAYVDNPQLTPASMLDGLSRSAVYYAQQLLKHHYFRLDPIASLFWRIYDGAPLRRADPIGVNELAVDQDGAIYPSWRLMGDEAFRVGTLEGGKLNEEALAAYENLGSGAIAECRRCWARNLCGGGSSAVHAALSGSVRKPHEAWCNAQRSWMGAAVSAFNLLSSQGVNFARVYNTLTPSAKPSLFTMLRAAMGMTIVMRPIEEADAEMLVRWENWDESAYFLFNERGTLLATKYDREMDSIHPQSLDMEMILVRKTGQPIGLLKFRPDRVPGVANAWLYLRRTEDYAADDIRKGFRFLLKQAGTQQGLRRIVVPAAAHEKPLQDFLTALGFAKAGTQREALYLHGKYHDVNLYTVSPESL
jgi:uncharacterized protein